MWYMRNAYTELEKVLKEYGKKVSDIETVGILFDPMIEPDKRIYIEYPNEENFKTELNFDYDDRYDGLIGVVCFKDSTWLERNLVDGMILWCYKKFPDRNSIVQMISKK